MSADTKPGSEAEADYVAEGEGEGGELGWVVGALGKLEERVGFPSTLSVQRKSLITTTDGTHGHQSGRKIEPCKGCP